VFTVFTNEVLFSLDLSNNVLQSGYELLYYLAF